jgi:hypothetical protein
MSDEYTKKLIFLVFYTVLCVLRYDRPQDIIAVVVDECQGKPISIVGTRLKGIVNAIVAAQEHSYCIRAPVAHMVIVYR